MEQGVRNMHSLGFHTLWAPRIRRQDILVRKMTGERFLVTDSTESRSWRKVPVMQSVKVDFINQEDIVYRINDEKIYDAYEKRNAYGFSRYGISLFQWNIFG